MLARFLTQLRGPYSPEVSTEAPRLCPASTAPLDFVELVEFLGAGGFGEVWKARNATVRHLPPVALKFCLDPVAHAKLERHEAELTVLVGRVPISSGPDGVVTLRNASLKRDPSCLEYEYTAGGDLASLLREWQTASPPPYRQATDVIRRIARVVGTLHRHTLQVVHRDLKPSNVVVTQRSLGLTLGVRGNVEQAREHLANVSRSNTNRPCKPTSNVPRVCSADSDSPGLKDGPDGPKPDKPG